MKIAMVLSRTPVELPYDSRVLREAQALVDAGHSVCIFVATGGDDIQEYFVGEGIRVIAVPIRNIEGFSEYNPFSTVRVPTKTLLAKIQRYLLNRLYRRRYVEETTQILLRENFEAIHCHDFHTLEIGVRVIASRKAVLVYDSHEIFTETMAFNGLQGLLKKPFYLWKERQLIRHADWVIAVGNGCGKFLAKRYKIPLPVIVENVSEYTLKDAIPREEIRAALGVNSHQKLLMYQGLLAPGRGVETVIKAIPLLPDNYILAIVGFGPSEQFLRHLARRLGVECRIRFVGKVPREELLAYIRSADIGVIAIQKRCLNYYYAMPNKVFECIAAGVPFAVSDFPDMRNLAVNEGMGVVFNPEQPGSIAKAIKILFSNPEAYKKKQDAISSVAASKYNWQVIKQKLLNIYVQPGLHSHVREE